MQRGKEFTGLKGFTVNKVYREKLLSVHNLVTEDFICEN